MQQIIIRYVCSLLEISWDLITFRIYAKNWEVYCIADSVKVAFGIGKQLSGGHSSKSLHYSIYMYAQM